MTHEPTPQDDRMQELFIADLLFGLTMEEEAEYQSLSSPSTNDNLRSLAETIARLDQVKSLKSSASLPEEVRWRIRADADHYLAAAAARASKPIRRHRDIWPWLAVAASLLIAVLVFLRYGPIERSPDEEPKEMRKRLLASSTDVIRRDWRDGPTVVSGASGDIAWSNKEQRGYMRFRGLPANDPKVEQYQLWIFDRNQSEKTPIDGGVFDIPSNGEVVVPVRPALRVREPYLFAVTIEKPGGVVVSDRSRLPLLAAVSP